MDEEIRQALNEVREMKQMCGNINMKLTNIVTQRGQDIKKKLEDEYQRGLEDAWEAARKIADMWTKIDNDELLAIFGITERIGHSTIRAMFEKQTANEAMLELEAYEEKQQTDNCIEIGDEVETEDGKRFVVTAFGSGLDCDIAVGVCADGLGLGVDLKELHKTGRHFDIASILKEMQS